MLRVRRNLHKIETWSNQLSRLREVAGESVGRSMTKSSIPASTERFDDHNA